MTTRIIKTKTLRINEEYLVLKHICHLKIGWDKVKPAIEVHFIGGAKATFPLSAFETVKDKTDENIQSRLKYHLAKIRDSIENN